MSLRFRKSFKLAPGVRMNLSGGGASWSIGPRGATIGIGKRGAYLNAGIPGTGISVRHRIGNGAERSRAFESEEVLPVSVSVSVSDDGAISFNDGMGNELPDSLIKIAKRQHGEVIKELIQAKCEEINDEINYVGEIHFYTPSPFEKPRYELIRYSEQKPVEPIPLKIGFFRALFKSQRDKVEAHNQRVLYEYQEQVKKWENQKIAFELEEARRKILIEELIYTDQAAMSEFLECALQEIIWPRETSVSTDISAGGKVVFIDVDYPEIEDMPSKMATVPLSGYKLSVKDISATNIQKLYMKHVHGVAFRIIGEVFAALPKSEEVVMSGYSQRPNRATGQISDEYLLSVRVRRSAWENLAFNNLEAIDVVESLASFDLRRSMSKTGVFKPIEPFSPDEFSAVS